MKNVKGLLITAIMFALASGCVTDATEDNLETTDQEARVCWNSGLYNSPCGTVKIQMWQHEDVDYLGASQNACGETWHRVYHRATTEIGWMRAAAYCG